MIVKIQVTADDIAKGEPQDGCYCPIARACLRVFPSLPALVVSHEDLFADADSNKYPVAPLPVTARDFISRFDMYRPVEPFEFDLDVPDELAPKETRYA
jgi:hypothetical protein